MKPSTSFADVYNTQTAAIERLEAENARLRAENERLRKALAEVVMCSEFSSSTKDGCANIAREALTPTAQPAR